VPGTTEIPYMSSTGLPIPVLRTAEFIYGVMLCRLTYFYPRVSKAIGGNIFEFVLTALIVIVMSFGTDVHIKALFTVLIGVLIIQLSGAAVRYPPPCHLNHLWSWRRKLRTLFAARAGTSVL